MGAGGTAPVKILLLLWQSCHLHAYLMVVAVWYDGLGTRLVTIQPRGRRFKFEVDCYCYTVEYNPYLNYVII